MTLNSSQTRQHQQLAIFVSSFVSATHDTKQTKKCGAGRQKSSHGEENIDISFTEKGKQGRMRRKEQRDENFGSRLRSDALTYS
jgi:hypothetical protein